MRTVRYGSDYAASFTTMQEGFYAETNFIEQLPHSLQNEETVPDKTTTNLVSV